jgi:glyoxylase-like metal-dependent hydrolase (beta-lactamase superfamily II)
MSDHFRFRVGEIECIAVSDGMFSYPVGWLFANVPPERLEASLRERDLPVAQVETPYTCLLLKASGRNVLIDTGADGLAPTTGNLIQSLADLGVPPTEIAEVVLTHGHPDHIGGLLDRSCEPAFPNARYTMSKTELDFWTDPAALHDCAMDAHMKELVLGCARKNLSPLRGQMELIEGEKEIVPGVQAIPAPGHTPGHLALLIGSGRDGLLHVSDAVLHPLHMENPEWRNIFDLDEATAVKTRQRLLDRAAADGLSALAYHFPFPGLGHVQKKNGRWKWEAVS